MDMLIVTSTPALWATFADTMTADDHHVRYAADTDAALTAVKVQKPALVLWDVIKSDAALREDCVKIMMIDVRIHQCAATGRAHQDFHDVTEGMGFLPEISAALTADDARRVLASIAAIEKH